MQLFLMVTSIYILAIISPGPDFMMVARNALLYSRNVAIYTAAGISAGVAVHLTYCIFGLPLITDHFLIIANIIKYIGGSYLIYIGMKGLFSKNDVLITKNQNDDGPPLSLMNAFKNGLYCNLFNPKACLFFISLFTLISKEHIPLHFKALYGIGMIIITLIWFCLVTILFTIPVINQKLMLIQNQLIKILSLLLVILGCYLFTLNF